MAVRLDEVVDQLAYHYDRSDAGDKAIEYLLRAGDKAARAYLMDEAVAHYQRALQRIDELAMDDRVTAWRFHALAELGKTLMRSSRYDDAEMYLRQSIAWGKEKNLPVKEVVRLHWWLGDLLMNWNVRYAEMLQLGLDGLAMLPADERESAEAAMMYGIIAFGYQYGGDEDRFQQTVGLLAGLLRRLPYTEEFRVCYGCVIEGCWWRRDLDEADYWREHAERQARLYHVDWALAEHMWVHSYSLFFRGAKPHEAIDVMQESSSLFARVGDTKRVNWADISLAEILGDYGDSSQAETLLRAALPTTYKLNDENIPDVLLKLASSCLAQHKLDAASDVLQEALQQMESRQQNPAEALVLLGFVELGSGNQSLAVERFTGALHAMEDADGLPHRLRKWYLMVNSFFANALYGLECAFDEADTFRAFCKDYRAKHPAAETAAIRAVASGGRRTRESVWQSDRAGAIRRRAVA